MYHLLYTRFSIIHRLFLYFRQYFFGISIPTARNLFLVILSVLSLEHFQSVRFAHRQVISKLSETSLNAIYYSINDARYDYHLWNDVTVQKSLAVIPKDLDSLPLLLSIDDTLIEKYGKKFEKCSTLFDHAAHNGSNYLNGHCLVSLLLSVPVIKDGKADYISIPVGHRLWDKTATKLELAASLVRRAMKVIGKQRQVLLLCDSWYPKEPVTGLVDEFENLDMICNVRTDTVMYDLPPEPEDGKRGAGRPRKYGDRIRPEDFELITPKRGNLKIGKRMVLTKLWKDRRVYAFVTEPKDGGSRRLFLSTKDPKELHVPLEQCCNDLLAAYAKEDETYIPLALYAFRWDIEVSFYEEKTFWSLGGYRIRSSKGIERLVNLLTMSYSAMKVLPYADSAFSEYKSVSVQEAHYAIGEQIRAFTIFSVFAQSLQTAKNGIDLIKTLMEWINSRFQEQKNL